MRGHERAGGPRMGMHTLVLRAESEKIRLK